MTAKMTRRHLLQHSAAAGVTAALASCSEEPELPLPEGTVIGPFGKESTAEEVTAGLDLSGKTALVTGANSGLGYETMRVLALRGAHVIGTARTQEKANTAWSLPTLTLLPHALKPYARLIRRSIC